MIEATIDMNLSENHEYVIKPSFDEGLTGKLVNNRLTDFMMWVSAYIVRVEVVVDL